MRPPSTQPGSTPAARSPCGNASSWHDFCPRRVGTVVLLVTLLQLLLLVKVGWESWSTDCFLYERMALSMARGAGSNAAGYVVPPLLPWLMSSLSRFGYEPGVVGIWISMISFEALLFMVYGIAAGLYGRRWGWVAVAAMLVHPGLLYLAVVPLRDGLFLTLSVGVLASMIAVLRGHRWYLLWIFPLGMLAALARAEGIEVPILALGIGFALMPLDKATRRRLVLAVAIGIGLMIVGAAVLASLNQGKFGGAWTMSSYFSRPLEKLDSSLAEEHGSWLRLAWNNFLQAVDLGREFLLASYVPFFLIGGLGLLRVWRRRVERSRSIRFILWAMVVFCVLRVMTALVGFELDRRHLVPIAFLYCLFIPFGLMSIREWLAACVVKWRASGKEQRRAVDLLNWLVCSPERYGVACILLLVLLAWPKSFRDRHQRDWGAPYGIMPTTTVMTADGKRIRLRTLVHPKPTPPRTLSTNSVPPTSTGPLAPR